MKLLSLILLLLLSGCVIAQTPYHSVPDSLTCITPDQDRFFIGQSFTIKSLQTTIILKDKEIDNHIAIEDAKDKQLNECHDQVKLNIDQFSNCQVDMQVERNKVALLEKKSNMQKFILYITVPLAGIETSILSAMYLIKKAQ